MTARLATYVDRTGKPPAALEQLRLESADAVKTAKFFAALGFTLEKRATPERRQYVLAKATNIELSIFPSRAPKPAVDWSMTLMVDDAAAAATRAEATGGTIAAALKDIPGGKKCVVASPEGHRVVIAQVATKRKPAAAAPSPTSASPTPAEPPAVAEKSVAKPIAVAKPTPMAKPFVAEKIEAAQPEPDFLELAAESMTAVEDDPLAAPVATAEGDEAEKPAFSFGGLGAKGRPGAFGKSKSPSRAPVPAPEEYDEPAGVGPKAVSLQAAELLSRVRKACGILAAGILLPMLAGVLVYATMGSTSRDAGLARTLFNMIAVVAAMTAIVGKGFCIGKRAEFVDDGLVKSALGLDIFGLLFSLGQSFFDPLDDIRIFLQVGSAVCELISPILFAKYLGRIAEGVRERNLMGSARRAEIGLIVAGGAMFFAVALGAIVYMLQARALAQGMLVLVLITAVIALIALILYAAALAAFATNMTLKLVKGSAEADGAGRKPTQAGSASFGGGTLFGSGASGGAAAESDHESAVMKPSARRALEAVQRVRATCGIMAGTWVFVVLAVIYAVVVQRQMPVVQIFATAMLALAKLPCLSKTDRLGNSTFALIAFVLDLIGIAMLLAIPFAASERAFGVVIILGIAESACSFASAILFTIFLSEVADYLGMGNVAMFVKTARVLYILSAVFGAYVVALPFVLGKQPASAGAGLLLTGLVGLGLTFLLATLADIAGTVTMALNAKPPVEDDLSVR